MKRRVAFTVVAALLGMTAVTHWIAAAQPLPPQMHTVAGAGSCSGPVTLGGPCDGVSATSVPISGARSVSAVPGGGYLYIDWQNDLVRQVSPAGTVTTVAGTSTTNAQNQIVPDTTDVDGVPATSSGLDDPMSVAALPNGGFLITEYCGSRVRLVSPGPPGVATITTIAGAPPPDPSGSTSPCPNAGLNTSSGLRGTSVPLNYPMDAQPTASGGVLIADTYNNRIMLLSSQSPIATISEIAVGQHPDSVSELRDSSGGYVFAELDESVVQEVSQEAPTGTVTTVAGEPSSLGYSGDGGPATSAQLDAPEQVTSTPGGGFLIADTGNAVVRQVSATGTISTIAGDGFASYAGDGGDATAASLFGPASVSPLANGNLLIADQYNNRIREITLPSASTISFSPSSPNGSNGWYTSSVTAKVKATEGAKINCILDPPAAPPAFGAIPAGCSYTGSGAAVSGNGVHTLYAASQNSFGDQELPVDATVMIDTTPPTVSCNGQPSFRAGARHATVTATVSDAISGPVAPIVSARANTSNVGLHHATLAGVNNAGFVIDIFCNYTILPVKLKPAPSIHWTFATTGSTTIVRRLVVSNVAAQAAVNVVCTGTGCPFASAKDVTGAMCGAKPCTATPKLRRHRRTVDVTALLAHAQLHAGARFSISVTKKNTVGALWQFQARTDKAPSHRAGCLQPGSSQPDTSCKP
jgi:hypothetical protein